VVGALYCALGAAAHAAAPIIKLPISSAASVVSAQQVSDGDRDEIGSVYRHLEDDFYKQVDRQVLLNGAHENLVAYLKANGISNPTLPALRAVKDDTANITELRAELQAAYTRYGQRLLPRNMFYAELSGLAQAARDRYTAFLRPKEYAALNEDLDGGNFSGVGLSINFDSKSHYLHVNEVIEGGPAEKMGILSDDLILSIDGKSTKNVSTDVDSHRLRGKAGSLVRLGVVRDGKRLPHPIAITRAVIHQPSVISKMLPGHVGYLHLTVFGSNTGRELDQALTKLDGQDARAYVLDLRDNGGGYLTAAVDVASRFVPNGPIVSVKERGGSNTQYNAEDTAIAPRPLVVLVNRYTASASEITSGAIQDNGVGTLMGSRTFGKGVVQTIFPIADGSAIKVTTARYYTPNGRDINSVGIQPDISSAFSKNGRIGILTRDSQLQQALTYLRSRVAVAKTVGENR
jgi:carboxyl-terminal processing protease